MSPSSESYRELHTDSDRGDPRVKKQGEDGTADQISIGIALSHRTAEGTIEINQSNRNRRWDPEVDEIPLASVHVANVSRVTTSW